MIDRETIAWQSPAFRAKARQSVRPTAEEEAHKARTYNPKGETLPNARPSNSQAFGVVNLSDEIRNRARLR